MEEKSKQSGINPVKIHHTISSIDIEPIMKLFGYTSLPFNRFNLSDSYLALAEVKRSNPE